MNLMAFRSRSFSVAVVLVVVMMATLFGMLILLPIYLQQVLALDTLSTGLLLLPGGALMGVLAPIVGNLFDRFGPRPLVLPGAVVASAGLWGLTLLSTDTPVWYVVLVHCVMSTGLAFMFTPLLTSALGSLPRNLYPHGSAIVSTLQQVAGAAGTALFVTLMSVGSASAIAAGEDVVVATASGIHTAFLIGAFCSLVVIVIAMFVRNPPANAEVEVDRTMVH
jgi:DHA2 family lincomycin resistance protein-like MFS transporter